MPLYLDTAGEQTLAIGICARCSRKFPIGRLRPDRNSPGLLVCDEDNDVKDPWRLPFQPADRQIAIPNARPDTPIPNTECYVVNELGEVVEGACPTDLNVTPSSQ